MDEHSNLKFVEYDQYRQITLGDFLTLLDREEKIDLCIEHCDVRQLEWDNYGDQITVGSPLLKPFYGCKVITLDAPDRNDSTVKISVDVTGCFDYGESVDEQIASAVKKRKSKIATSKNIKSKKED